VAPAAEDQEKLDQEDDTSAWATAAAKAHGMASEVRTIFFLLEFQLLGFVLRAK